MNSYRTWVNGQRRSLEGLVRSIHGLLADGIIHEYEAINKIKVETGHSGFLIEDATGLSQHLYEPTLTFRIEDGYDTDNIFISIRDMFLEQGFEIFRGKIAGNKFFVTVRTPHHLMDAPMLFSTHFGDPAAMRKFDAFIAQL